MKHRLNVTFILCLSATGLAGCYEDLGITLHKAHVYKGRIDKHQDDSKTRSEKLNRRFQLVQTDR